MDKRPKWVRILKFISIVIPILMVVYAIIEMAQGIDVGLFLGLIFIVILIILGMWLFGFLIHYLIKKEKSGIALAISIICFFISLIWEAIILISSQSGPYPSDISFNMVSILVYLLPLIYFGIAWILVYKIRSKN